MNVKRKRTTTSKGVKSKKQVKSQLQTSPQNKLPTENENQDAQSRSGQNFTQMHILTWTYIKNSPLFIALNKKRKERKIAFEKKYGHDDGHRSPTECIRCRKKDSVCQPDTSAPLVNAMGIARGPKNPYEAFCQSCYIDMSLVGMVDESEIKGPKTSPQISV